MNSSSISNVRVAQHAHVMQLILEEFGKWVKNGTAATEAQRDAFYTLVYDALQMVCTLLALCYSW